jgi:putative membrane protein
MSGERDDENQLVSLAVRLGVNAGALWTAAAILEGFEIDGWQSLLGVAAIFAVVNTLIKPVAQLIGCAFTVLTLGLFALIINAAMLALTVWVGDQFGLDVVLDDFWDAILAALIVTVTSWVLNLFVGRPVKWALR